MIPSDIDDWEDFLKSNGCSNIADFGDWIMCDCLFHEQSDNTRPSLGINKAEGYGNCFGCGGHSWEELCELFGVSSDDFIDGVKESRWQSFRNKVLGLGKPVTFKRYQLPEQLSNILGYKNTKKYFIDERHFDKEVLEAHEVRLCLDKSSKYYNHAIFPVYDEKGVLYFDARYMGNKDKPRWRRPKDAAFDRSYFNWTNCKGNYLCFVEGATDALKMIQFGIKNTIPAKHFSTYQFRKILQSGIRHLFLGYDEDEAGKYSVSKRGFPNSFEAKAKYLFTDAGIYIHRVEFPDYAKDPGDIKSLSDLQKLNSKLFEIAVHDI